MAKNMEDQLEQRFEEGLKLVRTRLSPWRTELMHLLALLVYVGLIELIVGIFKPSFSGTGLLVISIIVAVIPGIIWMSVFYSADRLEPEPMHHVLAIAVLGGLLCAAISQPLLTQFFKVSDWIGRDTLTTILGGILVVGFLQEFLTYAAVRYSIYYSRNFDERMDGVVYGSAAGLGFAVMQNIIFVVNSGGVDLGTAIVRIAVTQMVLGALGALLGYFMGRNRIDRMPIWWMPLGLALAAVINGLFSWIRGEITETPIRLTSAGSIAAGYNPWPGLILATALAAVLLGIIFYLIRLDIRADEALFRSTTPPAAPPATTAPPATPPATAAGSTGAGA